MNEERTHIHLIGIAGSGLSAIARVLLENGYIVSGSDRQDSPVLAELAAAGAQVYVGHQAGQLAGADIVVRSSAVTDDNPEVQEAHSAGIPVLKRSDFLERLTAGKQTVAIAGTHGKTTTTAMTAWMLSGLGQDPSFIVGGTVKGLETNAKAGQGPHFVIEADEYDGMFLGLRPSVAVVTNLEHDHPDCYPTLEDYRHAFRSFTANILPGGLLLACGDDPGSAGLLQQTPAQGVQTRSYGLQEHNDYQACHLEHTTRGGFSFDFCHKDSTARVNLQVPGQHNVLNATAALAVAHYLGFSVDQAARALEGFRSTGRRFEIISQGSGVTVIDDYAHHPSEIRATLAAARQRFPGQTLWAVWQPHTYSRTRTLLDEFARAFADADHVVVTEIYAARETAPEGGFFGRNVAQAIEHQDVHFMENFSQAVALLVERLHPGDILLVLSAGDADQISAQVAKAFTHEESTP